ncbi:MAG: S9 family peptidase [Planctomycetaceae bacterium]|nr:S9 family peptidase [Planctomycetaceae bacterium]
MSLRSVILSSVGASATLFGSLIQTHAQHDPPATRVAPVTDEYHGIKVTEDYRWLEDAQSDEVREWTRDQNEFTRKYLSSLSGTDQLRQKISALMSAETVTYGELHWKNGNLFAIKRQPPKQQPFLVVMPDAFSPNTERLIVDPNTFSEQGIVAIDWFEPSPDGKLVAVSLSSAGSEAGDVYVFNTETGRQEFEVVPRVNTGTAGGDLAWAADGKGFFYTRHPRDGERPAADLNFYQQAWFHKLGTPLESDVYELGADFPRIAEIEFELHEPSGQLLLTVQNGDGGQFAHYLRSPEGSWRQFSRFDDSVIQATFGSADYLFAMTRENAPRGQLIRIDTTTLNVADAPTVVAQGDDTIVNTFYHAAPSLVATDSRLYVLYQQGGPSTIKVFDHSGTPVPGLKQPAVASISGMCRLPGDDILFQSESFVSPAEILQFSADKQMTARTPLSSESPASFDDVEVRREYAVSADGTRIPVNIMIPGSARSPGPHPCIVYGYGGYGINLTPRFSVSRRALFDAGIIYVVANLRGGGEFGEDWHRQGMLTRKQNVFDDFAAACRYMIQQGYTSSEKLATMGGSNGGLLMGATLTQNPQLMKCVVSYVGIYDMLRVELSPNGSFNIPEFGTVADPDQFRALRAYSPIHNVRHGTPYPAVMFLTGENDPRVDPMQSRKMTAQLQASTSSSSPILLRTSADAGHGGDTPLAEQIEQNVDVYSFLINQLGAQQPNDGRPDAETR